MSGSEQHEDDRRTVGNPRVDAAVARTDDLAARPVEEHVAAFEDAHQRLREALTDPDPGTDEAAAAHPGGPTAQRQ